MMGVDLNDPAVRRLMGHAPKREVVQLAGDTEGSLSGANNTGLMTIHVAGGKSEVLVRYKDFIMTMDVYALPDEPMQVHLICPRCRHQNRVTSDRKRIEYDPRAGDFKNGGRLDIEPFECAWEMPDAGEHTPGLRTGGASLCKLRIGISNNVARDA